MTSSHLAPNDTPGTDARGPWLRLSAALTGQVPAIADRDDLVVSCAPGAGQGSPGCFLPDLATIEIDAAHLPHDPDTCHPARPTDRDRYPALWGVLTHEAAHARHSTWYTGSSLADTGSATPAACVEAAKLLEEPRIEAAQLTRRPGDRHWLRASARDLVLADFTPDPANPHAPRAGMNRHDAARAAALLLARVDAGVLDADETSTLAVTVGNILGEDLLAELRDIWQAALTTGDTDQTGMLELGRRWCTALGADPDTPPPADQPGTAPGHSGTPSGTPSPLAEAITTTLVAVADADAPATPSGPDRAQQRKAEQAARDTARKAARVVFAPCDGPGGRSPFSPISGTRPPTGDEQAAARRLARALRAAAHRERATTQVSAPTPPGRLRMREAMAADAQRAAGAIPTAQPFTQTLRRHVPTPPLRLGVACDVSGSMDTYTGPVASAAWILARAASHISDARSATVTFGASVHPVTYPGHTPTQVREFTARDGRHQLADALDALDHALDLSRPGATRLLVIVSDGMFTRQQRDDAQKRVTRLTRSGCAVLWLAVGHADPLDHTHPLTITHPADAAQAIAQAATRALRQTP